MIEGSCLCGAVRWQADQILDEMTHCHCSMCRKSHGAPFATYVSADRDRFRWVSGEGAITEYQSSPNCKRSFCSHCGSIVPGLSSGNQIEIPAGGLEGDPGTRPTAHIFVASKAPWHEITDDLPQFDTYPDPDDGPIVERPAHIQSKDGKLRGSCLCGDIAYEVSKPIKAVYNCHCLRCRKARAAAHTTNGFTTVDGVKFVRGEDKLKIFKLPSARFFTQVFCKRCGSKLPRLDAERGRAGIPFGSLDDDPGRGADTHIFVGSMAPWYAITGDLPRFDEMPE